MSDELARSAEACRIAGNAMAWLFIDEELSNDDWAGIQKRFPEAADQIFDSMDTIDRAHGFYRDGKITLDEFKKTVREFFNLVIEVISAYRGRPALYLLKKKKR